MKCPIHGTELVGNGTALTCALCQHVQPGTDEAPWSDRPDQFTDRVRGAHPVMCKDEDRHARYALAMEMIHSRHGKYALVDLVNWLLTKWPELQSEAKR